MGRRAADLTTPVPVLGIPALVGVRSWKTTRGDRGAGGVLLQSCGIQCSVGVQTSPGINRAPTTYCAKLPASRLSVSSEISNGYFSVESDYKEISLLTKSDREKRAILKQKSGEPKTKKEVTFKAGEPSKDVASGWKSGTYCYARAIKTNPQLARNPANVKPKLKSISRYANGSVVDSEAIGGISIDNGESESVSGGMDLNRQQGHYAEQPGMTPPLSAARPFPQKICSHCGGRQPESAAAHTCLRKTLFNMKAQNLSCPREAAVSMNQQILYPNEDRKYRNIPHPACPVHSLNRTYKLTTHQAKITTPTTILNSKSITVTKATIETRQCGTVPRPTSLPLTPLMATATKTNNPQMSTFPMQLKTSQHKATDATPNNSKPCTYFEATPKNSLLSNDLSITKGCQTETETPGKTNTSNNKLTSNLRKEPYKTSEQHSNIQLIKMSVTQEASTRDPSDKSDTMSSKENSNITSLGTESAAPEITSSKVLTKSSSLTSPDTGVNLKAKSARPDALPNTENTLCTYASTKHNCPKPVVTQISQTLPRLCTYTASPNTADNLYNIIYTSVNQAHSVSKNSSLALPETQNPICANKSVKHNTKLACNDIKYTITTTKTQDALSKSQIVPKSSEVVAVSDILENYTENTKQLSANIDLPSLKLETTISSKIQTIKDERKCNGNLIHESVTQQSQDSKRSSDSQVSNLQNYISLIKSNSSCLQGCVNTKQRRTHYQGYSELEAHGATCPPVKTAAQKDPNTEQFALGITTRDKCINFKSGTDEHTNSSASPVKKQENNISAMRNDTISSGSQPHSHSGQECSFTAPASFHSIEGPHTDLKCTSILSSPTIHLASVPCLQPSQAEETERGDSEFSPSSPPPQRCTKKAHSHPVQASALLLASPQSAGSEALQQRLESVEASLAANKDRITTLLNIIHDLETSHTPTAGQPSSKSGQDLKNCKICQKTACIVYSVEYDFRQQEKRFMKVLNHSATGKNGFSTHSPQTVNFSLLKDGIIKNLTVSKVKRKKLCKTLFKWLPRKKQV